MRTQPNIDSRFLELLHRWVEGNFTRADERELKTLTDSDDFLREAMEGFAGAPEADHRAHLQALRAGLSKRSESLSKPASGGLFARRSWLAAAASIALLVLAWWYVPRWTSKNEATAPVAQQAPLPDPNGAGDTLLQTRTSATKPGSAKSGAGDIAVAPLPKPGTPPPPAVKAADPVQAVPSGADAAFSAETSAPLEINLPDEKENNAGAAAPSVDSPANRPLTAVLPAREAAEVKKAPPPAERARAKEKSKQDSEQWHETDRKPQMDSIRSEALADLAAPEQSAPAEGWDAFNEYLRLNARLTERARDNNITGAVRVQFSVDEDGNPGGFIFLRSLAHGLDEEAVRLIKSREWLRGTKRQNVTIEVRFVR
jgi:Gram-negative bacterial TonB protein C-terminal